MTNFGPFGLSLPFAFLSFLCIFCLINGTFLWEYINSILLPSGTPSPPQNCPNKKNLWKVKANKGRIPRNSSKWFRREAKGGAGRGGGEGSIGNDYYSTNKLKIPESGIDPLPPPGSLKFPRFDWTIKQPPSSAFCLFPLSIFFQFYHFSSIFSNQQSLPLHFRLILFFLKLSFLWSATSTFLPTRPFTSKPRLRVLIGPFVHVLRSETRPKLTIWRTGGESKMAKLRR